MKLLDIYAGMKKEIKEIEQELEAAVRSDHELLNETSLHLLKAGGKESVRSSCFWRVNSVPALTASPN